MPKALYYIPVGEIADCLEYILRFAEYKINRAIRLKLEFFLIPRIYGLLRLYLFAKFSHNKAKN